MLGVVLGMGMLMGGFVAVADVQCFGTEEGVEE